MYIALFLSITSLFFAVHSLLQERSDRIMKRLRIIEGSDKQKIEPLVDEKMRLSMRQRIWLPLLENAKKIYRRKLTNQQQLAMEKKLLQAGSPLNMTTIEFRLVQTIVIILMPTLFFGFAILANFALLGSILSVLVGLAIGNALPNLYLKLRSAERSRKALRELPDVLDLLTVSLEAGLGFDSALARVVSRQDGVLHREFQRCLEEIRLGRTRKEALTGVRERLLVTDINVLITNIIQAEKLGIGLVQVLRVQSEEVRKSRRQRAEEKAMKAPIKILFPLVFFIFPSIFIVLLAPAIIQFVQSF